MDDYSKYGYTAEDLRFLEDEEKRLSFDCFNAHEACRIGCKIMKTSEEDYGDGVSVQIIRLKDNVTCFQYVADSKGDRNLQFAAGKKNACIRYGHSSFYAFVKEIVDNNTKDLFPSMEMIQAAGAYPVFVDGNMEAVIAVSGLSNGDDHRLIVKALSELLGKEYIPFSKQIV